jgi:hypothetical protein
MMKYLYRTLLFISAGLYAADAHAQILHIDSVLAIPIPPEAYSQLELPGRDLKKSKRSKVKEYIIVDSSLRGKSYYKAVRSKRKNGERQRTYRIAGKTRTLEFDDNLSTIEQDTYGKTLQGHFSHYYHRTRNVLTCILEYGVVSPFWPQKLSSPAFSEYYSIRPDTTDPVGITILIEKIQRLRPSDARRNSPTGEIIEVSERLVLEYTVIKFYKRRDRLCVDAFRTTNLSFYKHIEILPAPNSRL